MIFIPRPGQGRTQLEPTTRSTSKILRAERENPHKHTTSFSITQKAHMNTHAHVLNAFFIFGEMVPHSGHLQPLIRKKKYWPVIYNIESDKF